MQVNINTKVKSLISVFLALFAIISLFSCSGTHKEPDKLEIVATVYPVYDWVREITKGNGNCNITLLLDSGIDMHSFQPDTSDFVRISTCDVFIYVGGESDKWVDDALKNAVNENLVVINLMDSLGDSVKEEAILDGMQAEDEDGCDETAEEETEYDEHIWLSLRKAQTLCEIIADRLAEADTENGDGYKSNAIEYCEKLSALDEDFTDYVSKAENKNLVFGDRYPFAYFADDYSLNCYAAFPGCSAETEASFETVAFLASKVDELSLDSVIILRGSDGKIADTIAKTATSGDVRILTLDSLQNITSDEINDKNVGYYSIMEKNISVLKEALH